MSSCPSPNTSASAPVAVSTAFTAADTIGPRAVMKKMKKLDLARVDLEALGEALEDHSEGSTWWIDPRSGEIIPWSDWLSDEDERPSERGWRRIEPLSSGESYADMEDFIERVRDPRARDLLKRAIEGRGAFRRFKDTLLELPDLRTAWFKLHDARMARRAIEWLREESLVDDEVADRAIATHEDPEPPQVGAPFDPDQVARRVAEDLRELYGKRLREVRLFGSWARGDATPESDLDLLVVLHPMEDPWAEHDRMDEILGRYLLDELIVVSAIPVSAAEFEAPHRPVLIRARIEGRRIA